MNVNLNSSDYDELFENAKTYRKVWMVAARKAKEGEFVKTVVGGYWESINTANEGDYIVTNPSGEEYIVPKYVFEARYEPFGDSYISKSRIRAVPNSTGKAVKIIAPWGEEMRGRKDCVFVAPLDENGNVTKDRYLIDGEIFRASYTEV